jgi:hypothetical protein
MARSLLGWWCGGAALDTPKCLQLCSCYRMNFHLLNFPSGCFVADIGGEQSASSWKIATAAEQFLVIACVRPLRSAARVVHVR